MATNKSAVYALLETLIASGRAVIKKPAIMAKTIVVSLVSGQTIHNVSFLKEFKFY